ncbi:hypothetical protein [Vibrio parahaemolyticus]|uniref:hypothetical protein n=1 Tax=Vibrio parahaemolyticus TaxID=670 RepID=UPI00387AE253
MTNIAKSVVLIFILIGIQGCGVEDEEVSIPPSFCGVVYQDDQYVVNDHPYSINYMENGSDIDDTYCVSGMFKTYSYIDNELLLSTEIRKGDSNELDRYITLAVRFGYQVDNINQFSLLGQAKSVDVYQNEFGWDLVENKITLETSVGEIELNQSVTLDEDGVYFYSYYSSDGQSGRYDISINDALLFFYGGESAFDAMSNVEYFKSFF